MSRLTTTSSGRVTVSLLVAIVLVSAAGITYNAARGQKAGFVDIRACQGEECNALNWCKFNIGNAQGTRCPPEIENGFEICVYPCLLPPAAQPCVFSTFKIVGLDCTFDGTPVLEDCQTCPLPDPRKYVIVNPPTAAIPTVSEWGMIVMGLLIVTVAVIVIRRLKATHPSPA